MAGRAEVTLRPRALIQQVNFTSGYHRQMDGVVTRASPWPVSETVDRFSELLRARGLKLFVVIDHSGEAAAAGLELRETRVVVFGSPAAGTPVMHAAPLAALDLPLKVLIWAGEDSTQVTYLAPSALAERYGLDAELAGRLAGIEPLVEALLAEGS
jgi:uncharacterized protein (DUF302 family)